MDIVWKCTLLCWWVKTGQAQKNVNNLFLAIYVVAWYRSSGLRVHTVLSI